MCFKRPRRGFMNEDGLRERGEVAWMLAWVTGRKFWAVASKSSSRLVTISWRGRLSRFRITWLYKKDKHVNLFHIMTHDSRQPHQWYPNNTLSFLVDIVLLLTVLQYLLCPGMYRICHSSLRDIGRALYVHLPVYGRPVRGGGLMSKGVLFLHSRYLWLKGTVQRDFNVVFWLVWIGLGLNTNRFEFIIFQRPPRFLKEIAFFVRLRRNSFRKILYFGKFLQIA